MRVDTLRAGRPGETLLATGHVAAMGPRTPQTRARVLKPLGAIVRRDVWLGGQVPRPLLFAGQRRNLSTLGGSPTTPTSISRERGWTRPCRECLPSFAQRTRDRYLNVRPTPKRAGVTARCGGVDGVTAGPVSGTARSSLLAAGGLGAVGSGADHRGDGPGEHTRLVSETSLPAPLGAIVEMLTAPTPSANRGDAPKSQGAVTPYGPNAMYPLAMRAGGTGALVSTTEALCPACGAPEDLPSPEPAMHIWDCPCGSRNMWAGGKAVELRNPADGPR